MGYKCTNIKNKKRGNKMGLYIPLLRITGKSKRKKKRKGSQINETDKRKNKGPIQTYMIKEKKKNQMRAQIKTKMKVIQ